jgi:hypothetical protein
MKVSNSQKPSSLDKGVSRETLNNWQRKDANLRKEAEAPREKKAESEDKQTEG